MKKHKNTIRSWGITLFSMVILSVCNLSAQVIQPYVKKQLTPADKKLFEKLAKCNNESVWGALTGMGYTNVFTNELKMNLHPELRMVGRARTIHVVPYRKDILKTPDWVKKLGGDNVIYLTFQAAEETQVGDILVIDAGGICTAGNLGDQMFYRFLAQGLGGMVVNGAIRDMDEIWKANCPIYIKAAVAMHAGPIMTVGYQTPVNISGAVVNPGDILLGDREGIVVVPAEAVEEVAKKAYLQTVEEAFYRELLKQGRSLIGLHPPDEETQKLWEEYKKTHPVE